MNLYTVSNGDASLRIFLFAESKTEARKMANEEIKKEELRHEFTVLCISEIKIVPGIIEIIWDGDGFY